MGLDRQYVQAQIFAADPEDHKASVRVATTTSLPAYTRVGNVITADADGVLPDIDGVTLAEGESMLLQHGADGEDNGIYAVSQLGDGSHPFILTRRADANADSLVTAGMTFRVMEGSTYGIAGGTVFVLQTLDPISLNVTPLTFGAEVSGFDPELTLTNADIVPATQGMAVIMMMGVNYNFLLASTVLTRNVANCLGFVNQPIIPPTVPGKIKFAGTVIIPAAVQVGVPWVPGDIIYLDATPGLLRNGWPTPPPNGQYQAQVGTVIAMLGPDAEMLIDKKLPIRMEPSP